MPNCVICNAKKAYYGARGSSATHCSACNKEHKLGLVNVSAKLCVYDIENGNLCPKQSKKTVNGRPLCGEHSALISGGTVEALKCKSEGCLLSRVRQGLCRTHMREAGIKATDDCVDCETPKRGSYKIDKIYLCKECSDKRKEGSDEFHALSVNRSCEGLDENGFRCQLRPSFAEKEGNPATRCQRCSEGLNWISVNVSKKDVSGGKQSAKKEPAKNHTICIINGCKRSKAYGYASDKKRLVCSEHVNDLEEKENDPIICVISSRKCQCGKIAKYGIDQTTHCFGCKIENMIRIVKSCEAEDCEEDPIYGVRNRETGRITSMRCEEHVEKGDVLVSKVLCKYVENGLYICDVRSSFKNQKGLDTCKAHSENGSVDTHRMCDHSECSGTKRAYFCSVSGNGKRSSPTRCYEHRGDGMVSSDSNYCENCGLWSVAGKNERESIRILGKVCNECKFAQFVAICDKYNISLEELKQIRLKQLSISEVSTLAAKRKRLLARMPKNPEKRKAKEVEIEELSKLLANANLESIRKTEYQRRVASLKTRISDPLIAEKFCYMIDHYKNFLIRKEAVILTNLIHNSLKGRQIYHNRSFSKLGLNVYKRPDITVDLDTHYVIIEIDEFEHTKGSAIYSNESESDRMRVISELSTNPIWMIRFNPDGYTKSGQRNRSLFEADASISSQVRFDEAMDELNNLIRECIANPPPRDFEIVYLRYSD